jgi:type IV pilus assembly protein PilQ
MKNPRRQNVYCGMLILVIAAIFVGAGCASREKVETIPAAVSHNLIKKIVTEDSDEGKKIIIEGEAPLAYAFSKLIPQPLQLVLDIPQAELASELTTPISVDDEVIKEISAIQHDDDVEVSIQLNKLVRYKVQKEGSFLSIDVGRQSPLLAKEEEQKGEEIEIVKEVPAPVQEEVITKELAPAKSLVDVFVDTSQKDKVILTLKADGKLGDYNSFDLQKPTRLVIDLWKVTRKFREKAVSVDSPYLKRVRLGDHPKKVRVVLDVPTTVLPSHRIDRMDDKLMIVMGKEVKEGELLIAPKEEIAQAPPKEVAEEEKKITPPTITGEITGIDFKQLGDKSRIIISTSVKAPYEVVETGLERTVLLEIQGMMVPPKLSRPLDTHEFASPVFMITPVNVTAGAQKNTQIFVKLRKMVAFDTRQEDSKIYIDFERPAEFAVAKPKLEEVITVKEAPTEEKREEPVVSVKEELPVKEAEVAPAPPALKAEPVLPPEEEVGKVYTGKKITLDFKEADIHNILRLFAEVSDLNIITTDDVKGKVTVRLVDVPWDQALDILLQANNLGVERIGNVIRIAPLGRLSAEKKAKAEAVKATEELEPLVSEVIPISYGDVSQIGEKGVKPILSERGTVVVDARTNTIVVTDIRSNVKKAKELVRTLDAQTPQVLIQAKVIEANLDFSRELGIQWGGAFSDQTQAFGEDTNVSTAGSSGGFGSGGWVVDLPAPVGPGVGGAIEFAVANLANTKYLQARISALEEKGQGEVISSPRITTLDNTESSIEQGLRIPYLKLTEEGTITTEFIEANLKLTVTPHVTADGHIRMEITLKKDTPDQSIVVQGVPSIDKKEVKTEVLVKDGEVVVIGGIYTYTKNSSVDAVPLFYKIPLLGWLFQKRSKDNNKKELLIFIAPRVVQPRRVISS